jgi:hypothetical protein
MPMPDATRSDRLDNLGAVFGVFAAFFGVAIVDALLLPEWRGRHLAEETAAA